MVDSTNLPEVDINQIATDLNNKMDRDGVNASCSVCIETWGNNLAGGRLYSDGYYEEWHTSTSTETITFKYPFIDSNYVVTATQVSYGSGTNTYWNAYCFTNKIASSIQYLAGQEEHPKVSWLVKGYIR